MRLPAPPTFRLPRTARSFQGSVAVSAAVHLAVIAVLVWETSRPPASPPAGQPGAPGTGGGQRVDYLALPAYRAPAAPDQTQPRRPPPAPVLRAEIRDVGAVTSVADVVPVTTLPGALSGAAGTGAGRGGSIGGAVGTGTGSGAGPGGGEGAVFPPQAQYSILPPLPKPASVRGKRFRVHFWVSATGRVTKVDVSPEIPDADYRKRFVQLMYEYTFTPAMRPDGVAVAGEMVITITL